MGVYIFVEDQLFEAYETLAQKHLGLPLRRDRSLVRVQRVRLDEVTTARGWQKLVDTAVETGIDCIVVVIDQEGMNAPDRPRKIVQIGQAFTALCARLQVRATPQRPAPKVSLIVAQSCLECWILADSVAVARYAAGRRGLAYIPPQRGRTEDLHPAQAFDALGHILRETDRRSGRRQPRTYEKSFGKDICTELDVTVACRNNSSLRIFLQQVECLHSGCVEH